MGEASIRHTANTGIGSHDTKASGVVAWATDAVDVSLEMLYSSAGREIGEPKFVEIESPAISNTLKH